MKIILGQGWIARLLEDFLLQHVSGSSFGHLQGAHKFSELCSFCVNLRCRNSKRIIKIIINIME